jgi:ABC-type transport system involved in multi-copper enzyme maturation permease subunit
MSAAVLRTWAVAWSGFLQLVRSRVYLNLLVAGVGLVLAALALDELSAGEGGRMLFDVGLAFSSLAVAALSGVVAITGLTREIETKQASLLLARPVRRAEYVVGRFLTSALLIVVSNGLLGALLAVVLWWIGAAEMAWPALLSSLFVSFEGFIVAAIATFFGVSSSSTMSAVFTTTLFILGRLSGELWVTLERGAFGAAAPVLRVIYQVLPHLGAFDISALGHGRPVAGLATAALYGCAYAGAFLLAATVRFDRRDLP